nr:unnamed protein product [Callosobruchus chinensis]
MTEDRLNALAVLSIEKKFVQSFPVFDNKVIEIFSTKKARRMDFMYKNKNKFFCAHLHSEPTSRH